MKSRHVLKVIDVFQRTCSCLVEKKKKTETPGSHYVSFSALRNLLTQTCLHFCSTGQLASSEHGKMYSYLLLHLFASLCHILYFDAAKFSIKKCFHWYIFEFLLSDNGMNMK